VLKLPTPEKENLSRRTSNMKEKKGKLGEGSPRKEEENKKCYLPSIRQNEISGAHSSCGGGKKGVSRPKGLGPQPGSLREL